MEERDNRGLIRDCINKLQKLNDYDWDDLIEKYELDYSQDHLRKLSYGMKLAYDTFQNEIVSQDESDLLNEKLLEIKKEKVKLQDMRTLVNKDIRNLARIENIVDLLKDDIYDLSNKKPMVNHSYINHESNGKDAVLLLGDLHYFMVCDNSVNKYNPEICKERLNKVIDDTIEKCLLHNIDTCNVIGLGDWISGEIHSTVRLQNAENLVVQIIEVSELISEVLYKLSKHLPYVTLSMVSDNHSRVYSNKDDNLNKDNYTQIIKEFIKLRTKDISNFVVLDNTINHDEIAIVDIKGKNIIACHGDKIATDNKCVEQLENSTNVNADIIVFGHIHNPRFFTNANCEIFVNGSLMGSDEYASNKKLFSKPSQTLLILDKDKSGVECSYVIKV